MPTQKAVKTYVDNKSGNSVGDNLVGDKKLNDIIEDLKRRIKNLEETKINYEDLQRRIETKNFDLIKAKKLVVDYVDVRMVTMRSYEKKSSNRSIWIELNEWEDNTVQFCLDYWPEGAGWTRRIGYDFSKNKWLER